MKIVVTRSHENG